MLKSLLDFLVPANSSSEDMDTSISDADIQLASAALLIELAKSDMETDAREWEVILSLLQETFSLQEDAVNDLVQLADTKLADSTDLFQFTQLINQHYSYEEKVKLVGNMWEVAYADERIDKFEDHLIRKVAGLIHVPHSDFIKAKHRAR